MIVLYFLAPILFYKMQNAALLVPGLLWSRGKPHRIKFASLALFLITLALSIFKINGAPAALAASVLLLVYGLPRMARSFYLPAIVFLLLFQGGLLAFRGTFDPAALTPALSYAFTNLIFVASEEVFLREVLRKKLGSGFFPALFLGLLWGLWHVPFHPTADYAAIQILHAAALSLLIDAIYDVSGLPTAIFLHSLHNSLPLTFRAAFSPADHLLFFLGYCTFSFFVTKVTATKPEGPYYRRKERGKEDI